MKLTPLTLMGAHIPFKPYSFSPYLYFDYITRIFNLIICQQLQITKSFM